MKMIISFLLFAHILLLETICCLYGSVYPTKHDLSFGVTENIYRMPLSEHEINPQVLMTNANWGDAAEDFRLSLVSNKKTYNTNENVYVELIIRNENKNDRTFKLFYSSKYKMHCPICRFELHDDKGTTYEGLYPSSAMVTGTGDHMMSPESQSRFTVNLKFIYHSLKPGYYRIRAKRSLPSIDQTREVEAFSGWATFRVVEGPNVIESNILSNTPTPIHTK